MFSKYPKSHQTFGLLLKDNLSPRTFKNSSIWSHCFGANFVLSFLVINKILQRRQAVMKSQESQESNQVGDIIFSYFIYLGSVLYLWTIDNLQVAPHQLPNLTYFHTLFIFGSVLYLGTIDNFSWPHQKLVKGNKQRIGQNVF